MFLDLFLLAFIMSNPILSARLQQPVSSVRQTTCSQAFCVKNWGTSCGGRLALLNPSTFSRHTLIAVSIPCAIIVAFSIHGKSVHKYCEQRFKPVATVPGKGSGKIDYHMGMRLRMDEEEAWSFQKVFRM